MYFVKIMLLTYFVIGFIPVFRFHKHRFFYYIFLSAVIDPFFFISNQYFYLNNFTYFYISYLAILWSFPLIEYKLKTLISIPFFISIYRYDFINVLSLIIMDSTFFFIFLKIIECYIAGQKTEGKGEVFLIILFLKSLLSGLIIFLFVEEFSVFVQIYLYLLLINILLITVLSLTGAKSKIRMPLLKFGNKIKLFSSVKGYNYQVDDINNHLPLNTRKNNNNEICIDAA